MNITINGRRYCIEGEKKRLFELLREAGFWLEMPCAGRGVCKKCAVYAKGALSPICPEEEGLPGGMRLACATFALGDCEIFLPEQPEMLIESGGRLLPFEQKPQDGWGFAVDVGTTTVAVYLCRGGGGIVASRSFQNPQSAFGADVISRIAYAQAGGAERLRAAIVRALEECFLALCAAQGVAKNEVRRAVITGNTTMLYLLMGEDVGPLSCAPFEITERYGGFVDLRFAQFARMEVFLPNCISAFVGADITCAILAGAMTQEKETALLADVGTNGELALWHGGRLFCCSTAAGPALEGAGIAMGMSAKPGAIQRVWLRPNQEIGYSVVGGGAPKGICGSGILDAAAALLDAGIIDETGYLETAQTFCGQPAAAIGDSGVFLTGKDIRAIQLAKSAIRAGIETLLFEAGVCAGDVARFYIAGGFGSYLDLKSACRIGLFPPELLGRETQLGNAAGMGAVMLLLGKDQVRRCAEIAKRAVSVELGQNARFMEAYVEHMLF